MTATLTTNTDINQSSPQKITEVAIIGAGLTGLMTAHLLEQAFGAQNKAISIVIYEKSAGVGRLATRYKKPEATSQRQWQFDFGAQFFTAKSAQFQAYLQPWLQQGVIEPWLAKTATLASTNSQAEIELSAQWDSEQPRYISSPKMTSFGRSLADLLKHTQVIYKTRVAPLAQIKQHSQSVSASAKQTHKTTLTDNEGHLLGSFDWVVCSAPQAQALELLQQTDFQHMGAIKQPQMLACYTLMLGWQDIASLPPTIKNAQWDVLQVTDDNSIIDRLFIEHHKPSRDSILPSLTIHAANQWSETHVDQQQIAVQKQLLQAVQSILNWTEDTAPSLIDCHRWRYAATQPASENERYANEQQISYVDNSKQWIVTGDWCDEGRIESCFKAATKVVEAILA